MLGVETLAGTLVGWLDGFTVDKSCCGAVALSVAGVAVCSGAAGAVVLAAGAVVICGAGIVADGAECILVQPKYPPAATTSTIAAMAISLVLPPPSESCFSAPLPNEENVGGSTGAMCSFSGSLAGAGAAAAACPNVLENGERVDSATLIRLAAVELVDASVIEPDVFAEEGTGAFAISCHGDFCFESSIAGPGVSFEPASGSRMDSRRAASVGAGFT